MEEPELPPIGPMTRWHRWVRIPLAKSFCWIVFTILGPTISRHHLRMPKKGGLIVLSSHQSDLDPILVHLTSRRPIHFLAKSELFESKILGKWLRKFYAFPVKRGEPDRTSIRRAVALAKAGEVVGIFPEGELSETGEILPLKPGVALIIRMAGVPAICVGIRNARRMMPYGTLTPRPSFKVVSMHWGEPRHFEKSADNDEIMAWATAQLVELTGQPLMKVAPEPPQPSEKEAKPLVEEA